MEVNKLLIAMKNPQKKESGKIMCIGSSTLAPVVSKAGDTLKSKHGTWKKNE